MKARLLKCVLFFCAAAGLQAQVRTVPSADYPTIQFAIENSINEDTVVVNPGTYFENINFLGKAITVRSSNPDDPNTVAATIINGSAPADINNASVVTFNHGEGNNSVLEGFTITGGTGTWVAIAWRYYTAYWNRCGGGVVCYNMSQPTITKNRIVNNLAGEGGGIYVYGNPVNPANPSDPPVHLQPVISYNTFESNQAIVNHGYSPPNTTHEVHNHGDGGAIVCFQGVDANISDNIIQNNHAESYGGGIHFRQWSHGLIQNNYIASNNSALGSGIHITYESSPVIDKNIIIENSTIAGGGGGGIYVYFRSRPVITRNYILNNQDYYSGGIAVYWESNVTISNNVLMYNKGPAIKFNSTATGNVINNTIAYNSKSTSKSAGILCESKTSPLISGNIIAYTSGGYGIESADPSTIIQFNDLWQNTLGNYNPTIGDRTGTNGNISADPNFSGPNNFHIMPFSPCVNAGNPAASFPSGSLDIDGESRIFNGRVDIGADEMHLIAADFNTDGIVDLDDLLVFCDEWLSNTPPLQADLTGNGKTDLSDFAVFSGFWLEETFWKPL
ncbi:MAG: right-handed parallel beta-helix repeat-containing protein [Planctomycetes bacterium]|nr:right-handed parallel beta-helix repeat-containing protein [Planctomycetota bacterium]